MRISILACGGTLEKIYDTSKYEMMPSTKSCVREILKDAQFTRYDFEELYLCDSLYLTSRHFDEISSIAATTSNNQVVITVGTSRISELAKYLVKDSRLTEKTIVLVGAQVPASCMHSDATFNIGFAISTSLNVGSGVYVCLNGETISFSQ